MAKPADKFSAFIHLSVAVVQSGTDMIEEIGKLKGIRYSSDLNVHEPWQVAELRTAIERASQALVNYDACIAAGLDETTSYEFNAAKETA
jgi:hypothetical protein